MNTAGDWLVAVTAGRWQRNGIRKARALGLRIAAIDADADAEGFADADLVIQRPLDDMPGVLAALEPLRANLRGAVSFCSDAGVPLAAEIRAHFSLPGTRPDVCGRLVNKGLQRAVWARHGVPGPRVQALTDPRATPQAIARFGYPLIIKPADSSGSRGVAKLESPADDIADAVARAFQFSRGGQVLLESYMDGTEFTVETFSEGGRHHVLAVTEKKKVEGTRGTVARELATPERPQEVVHKIADAVVSAFVALGYTEGPGHAEIILMHDGEVGLVEVAGRGGGFLVFDRLVPAVSGVDVARLTVMQAVGMDVGPVRTLQRAAVLRFVPCRPGRLVSIRGLEAANAVQGVEAGAIAAVGQVFGRATADGDRLGYILSEADTPHEAQARADRAEGLLHFDIEAAA